MPFWLYLAAAYLGLSILSIRTFCEHQWAENPEGRTIIVEKSPLSFLFLNNNLHIVHHKLPAVAWYRLPALYRERRAEWQAMNGGYVFPNYSAILRAYGLRPKEPVAHPAPAPHAGRGTRLPAAPLPGRRSRRRRFRGADRAAEGMIRLANRPRAA